MIVDVGPIAHGGHCVARADGRVIFVRHALPGERVRVEITERRKTYWRGDAVEVLRSAPQRVEAPCRFAATCGGCDFQHVSQQGQRDLKTAVLREQLERIGGLAAADAGRFHVEELGQGLLGWRTRVSYAVDRQGRAGLRRHRSHDIVHIDECPIAVKPIRADSALSRTWRGAHGLDVVAADTGLTLYTTRKGHSRRIVSGKRTITEHAAGRDFHLDADAFWQVHPRAADTFAEVVRRYAEVRSGDVVWDLYAGAGLFAAVLAENAARVIAVEGDRRGRAHHNLADLPNTQTRYADVAGGLSDLPTPDVVVLDPPRDGAGGAVTSAIAAARPRTVVYVACDPAALARDLRTFAAHGYRLDRLRAFDAFPMTHHFETIARLRRADDAAPGDAA